MLKTASGNGWSANIIAALTVLRMVSLHSPCASAASSSSAISDPSSPPTADQETLRQQALIALQRFREQLRGPRLP